MNRCLLLLVGLIPALPLLHAEESRPLADAEILSRITWPQADFEATVFASPPDLSYPIFLSAAPDGALFVGCDQNGSLDQKPGRGSVVKCVDSQGLGKADRFTVFARMDSPRGVAWDASTRTLFVMHPPNLTAYHDDDNTGVANRQEDLVTGLGFGLDYRGADHTTNGIRLAADGWIYIAVGDYGCVKAVGKDGRILSMRGGGIVRVRPDGSGLERVIWGTRNILAVAVSPEMELFTRDNTNDGDDWNDRLSHNPFGAQMGYPTLFRNFPGEIIPTMVDYGGGSPVGSLFVDEPILPPPWNRGFFSVEWGLSEIDLHPLTPVGATWKAGRQEFMRMTRATDLDVDGAGHLYAASWDGATFNYNGPNVGYVVRLAPRQQAPPVAAPPDLKKLAPLDLVGYVGSGSGVWRLAAQRELLLRGETPGVVDGLRKIAESSDKSGARVAAIFTLAQLLKEKAIPLLIDFAGRDQLREFALKALGDDVRLAPQVPVAPLLQALSDPNPRVRLQAVTALGHLGKTEAAEQILTHTADPDFTVAHIAVQALRWLDAADVCLHALDSAGKTVQPGALRVLQSLYEPKVVEGLLARFASADPELRLGIFSALCRLDYQEAPYTTPHMWWGTRPDTSGPLFKPVPWSESAKIEAALHQALEASQGPDSRPLVNELMRTKVSFPGLTDLMLTKTGSDTASLLAILESMISPKTPASNEVLAALRNIAQSERDQPDLRARAFRALSRTLEKNSSQVLEAAATLAGREQSGPLGEFWEEFIRDGRMADRLGEVRKLAREPDPARRTLAQSILVNLVSSPVVQNQKARDEARRSLDEMWADPVSAASLLGVIGRMRAKPFSADVRSHLNDPHSPVAEAAEFALTRLGLDRASASEEKMIAQMAYEEVVATAVAAKGNPALGRELFLKQGCVICHTLSATEPPKGPMLGGIAQRYSRAELCESILKPSAKIAQGFESQYFKMKNGDQIEGFVVKEGGDSVEVRNIAGVTALLEKSNILERQKREKSIMPEGLAAALTPADLASLLAYLESTVSR